MTPARVRSIAARKKYDTRLGSPNNFAALSPLNIPTGSTYVMSCATYIPTFETGNSAQRHQRGQQEVFVRGIKERCLIQVRSPVTWRRVVFWSNDRYTVGLPPSFDPAEGDPVLRRNLRAFDPTLGGGQEATGRNLWQGTIDIDFSEQNRAFARLDPQKVRVVSDKTRAINPNFSHATDAPEVGKLQRSNFWHPVNKKLNYRQEEDGSNKGIPLRSGFTELLGFGPGNMYIMDIFSTGEAHQVDDVTPIATFSCQSTVYWHET